MSDDYKIYIIKSGWSLTRIHGLITKYGDYKYLNVVRKGKEKEITRITYVVILESVFEKLSHVGYASNNHTGFIITPFEYKEGKNESRKKRGWYIEIPSNMRDSEFDVFNIIDQKLNDIAEWGFIKVTGLTKPWNIYIPNVNRISGETRDHCFVQFDKSCDIKEISIARILINDSYWTKKGITDSQAPLMKCVWPRDKTPNKNQQQDPASHGQQYGQRRNNKYDNSGNRYNRNTQRTQCDEGTCSVVSDVPHGDLSHDNVHDTDFHCENMDDNTSDNSNNDCKYTYHKYEDENLSQCRNDEISEKIPSIF